MKKRADGDGSLYFSEAQQTWVGEVLLPNGKKKRKRDKLQKNVRVWLDEQRKAVKLGTWVDNESVKYEDFLDRYMKDVAAHSLRPKTLESYYFMIKNHIKPALGRYRLVQIRPEQIQSLYSQMLEQGLSKSTALYVHAVIHKTLSQALQWGLVARNVADSVKAPRPDKHPISPLTVAQAKDFLKVLEGDRLYAYYVVLLATGIRKGEGLGLQLSDVSPDCSVITINHSLGSVRGKGLILGTPKSELSRRKLSLPPFAQQVLKDHLSAHNGKTPYVFYTGNNTPFSPRYMLRHFKSALKKAALPETTRIHDLRHSFISWLIASGTSIKDVQMIAGHAQVSTTLSIYSHSLPGYNLEAANKIEGMFKQTEQQTE